MGGSIRSQDLQLNRMTTLDKRKPYNNRSDLEKIQSQWVKLTGLHDRTDWSAAVVRAATASEIAVNYAIRREFAARSKLAAPFVDSLLKWANGLTGKLDKLLLPLLRGDKNLKTIKGLCKIARDINEKRNDIVHRGEFCSEEQATKIINECRTFVVGIINIYEKEFLICELVSHTRK